MRDRSGGRFPFCFPCWIAVAALVSRLPGNTLNVNIEMPVVGWRLPARRSGPTRSTVLRDCIWQQMLDVALAFPFLLWVIFEPSVVGGFPRNRKEIQSVERLERCIREFGGFGRRGLVLNVCLRGVYACSLL